MGEGATGNGSGEGSGPSGESTGPGSSALFRKTISLPPGRATATVDGFVALFRVEADSDLRAVPDGGFVRATDGSDIHFTTPDGTLLEFDLEHYDPALGALTAWVGVGSVAAEQETRFELRYGTPPREMAGSPWSEGFMSVWHLDEFIGGLTPDDGPLGLDLASNALQPSNVVPGVVGNAISFPDFDDALGTDATELDVEGPFTIEAWGRLDGAGSVYPRLFHRGDVELRVVELWVEDELGSFGRVYLRINDDTSGQTTEVNHVIPNFEYGQWHYYVGVVDPVESRLELFVDGASVGLVSLEEPPDVGVAGSSFVGNWGISGGENNSRNWNGLIDEVRVHARSRSAAWVALSHRNLSDPESFFDLGIHEAIR